jgi:restriction system protein
MAKRKLNGQIPSYDSLMIPTIKALKSLGGSGTISEIYNAVLELLNLPAAIVEIEHLTTGTSEIEYRLAWSWTYLKKFGLLTNSSRGIWALASPDIDPDHVEPSQVVKFVREQHENTRSKIVVPPESDEPEEEVSITWESEMREILLGLQPTAFERLVQRLLRESGFIQANQETGALMASESQE